MTKQLLKTIEGIDIYIDEETGQFSATIGRREIKKRVLRDIEKQIEAISGAVTAYEIDSNYPRSPQKVDISRFEGDRARQKDGRLMGHFDLLYILDPENLSRLEEIAEKYRSVKKEFSEYVRKLPRLRPNNFEEVKQSQKAKP